MIFILVFELAASKVFQEESKLYRISIFGYVISEGAASLMLFVRGLINLLVDVSVISDIGKMNGMISGLAGISHIALGLFLILIFVSFLRGNKERNETASLAQVNFADISQSRIFINNKSCNLYFYFVLSINFLL